MYWFKQRSRRPVWEHMGQPELALSHLQDEEGLAKRSGPSDLTTWTIGNFDLHRL